MAGGAVLGVPRAGVSVAYTIVHTLSQRLHDARVPTNLPAHVACVSVCQRRMRPSLVLSDLLCKGSSEATASATVPAAKDKGGPKGFAFATSAFSGQSFEQLSASMLVTTPDTVRSKHIRGWVGCDTMPLGMVCVGKHSGHTHSKQPCTGLRRGHATQF